ncbi:MAG: signal peptidase II [Spirochaetia bacterium]|nr:signal peptidase II [Spirochaetia bacterium]
MAVNSDRRVLPFLLTVFVIAADQMTKCMIVKLIPEFHIGFSCLDGFFRIIHARNTAIAFSLGDSMAPGLKVVLFCIIPLAALILLGIFTYRSDSISGVQRWCLAGIIGGGLGNLVDRFFRPAGVVDFLDVKFYGLFGMERWPTFNVADAAIVVCGVILALTFIIPSKASHK